MSEKPKPDVLLRRYALGVEYDGSGFYGWQIQNSGPSVQGALETALREVAAGPIRVHCAGRTDTGVHGAWQVVHFDCPVERSERAWVLGANSNLPATVAVLWAREVPGDFHARYSPTTRSYRYYILTRPVRSALWAGRALWERQPLDVVAMARAAEALVGEHDFTSFRAAACQAKTSRRNVHAISVTRRGEWVTLEIQANAFLHNMIRIVTGTLLRVGRGEASQSWPAELLAARDRCKGDITASPDGLYLVDVCYPARYGLPRPGTGTLADRVLV